MVKLNNLRLRKKETETLIQEPETTPETIPTPETPETEQTATQGENAYSSTSSEQEAFSTEHLDGLIGEHEEIEQEQEIESAKVGMLGNEDFHKMFCGSFVTISHFTGFKSLYVEETAENVRAGTQALYDTILDVPKLHWLIQPKSEKIQRFLAIGGLLGPMGLGVAGEIKERKEAKKVRKPQNNDNAQADDLDGYSLRGMAGS